MYIGYGRLCVCLSFVAFPHYCTDLDVTCGKGRGVPSSCALLGGFAIGTRVSLLRQHNVKCKMSSRLVLTLCLVNLFCSNFTVAAI